MTGVLETVLYFEDQDRTERFYRDVLGMRLISKEDGRNLFFRAGSSVFLLFNAKETTKGRTLPPHGTAPGAHTCLLVSRDNYREWMAHLRDRGVEIVQEVDWPPGSEPKDRRGSSFYFYDPDGNLLEIADTDFWPR